MGKRLLITFFAFLLFPAGLFAGEVVVFHTSDTHGFYYPAPDQETGRLTGGFAALKSYVDKESLPHLLLDSGDFLGETLETRMTKGLSSIKLMNAAGYSAAAIGNHEFDYGEQNLLDLLPNFNFPVLAANIEMAETGEAVKGVLPYSFFNAGSSKVAVIGISRGVRNKILKYRPALTAIKNTLAEVEEQNPDIVILLIHGSLISDTQKPALNAELAKKFDGRIHLILGGHMHRNIQNKKIGNVYLVESADHARGVSRVEIKTDESGKFVSLKSEYVLLDVEKFGEDSVVKKLADELKVKKGDVSIGKALTALPRYTKNKNCDDSPLSLIIADSIKKESGAEIGIHNIRGSKADLAQGNITERDIFNVFPFNNTLYTVKVKGSFIKRFFISTVKKEMSIIAYSGVNASYQYKNGKVKNVKIFINGEPLNPNRIYTAGINSFLAEGTGEGWMFSQLEAENKINTGKLVREIIIKHIKEAQTLSAPQGCRVRREK